MYFIAFVEGDILNAIKNHCSTLEIVGLIIDSKIVFSLNNSFSMHQIKKSKNKCISKFCFTHICHVSKMWLQELKKNPKLREFP